MKIYKLTLMRFLNYVFEAMQKGKMAEHLVHSKYSVDDPN
jgi:hypothetical protein